MKKFIKNNIAVIISFFILFIIVNMFCISYFYNEKISRVQNETAVSYCTLVLKSDNTNELCLNIVNNKEYHKDTLSVYYDIVNNDYSNVYYLLLPF